MAKQAMAMKETITTAKGTRVPTKPEQKMLKEISRLRREVKNLKKAILFLMVAVMALSCCIVAIIASNTVTVVNGTSTAGECISVSSESSVSSEFSVVSESSEKTESSVTSEEEEASEYYRYSEEDALFFDKVFETEAGGSWWSKKLKQAYAEVMDNNVQTYGIEGGLIWPKFQNAKDYNYVVVHGEEVKEEDLCQENRELARKVREREVERLLPEDYRGLLPGGDCFFRKDGTYYGSAETFAQECGIEEYIVFENTVFFPEECWTDEAQAALDRYNASLSVAEEEE